MVAFLTVRRKKRVMNKTVKVLVAVLVAACVVALGYNINIFLDPINRWGVEQPAEKSIDAGVQTSTVGSSTVAQ